MKLLPWAPPLLLLLLLSCCSGASADATVVEVDANAGVHVATATDENNNNALLWLQKERTQMKFLNDMIDWIRSKGGTVNPKQEFRRADPSDPNSPMGVFCKEPIEKGEVLNFIPWDCIISDPDDDLDSAMACGTIHKFMDLIKTYRDHHKRNDNKKSEEKITDYDPYLAFLDSRDALSWPSGWTGAGQDLLELVMGFDKLPPRDAFAWYHDWQDECGGSLTNATEHEGVMTLLLRGEDNRIIPLYDMYNHRNGDKYFNTHTSVKNLKSQSMTASRDIRVGEQIYGSYNLCANCGKRRKNHYGTPEILRDYGFVEDYPQRWIFHHQEVGFDLEKDEDTGKLEVSFLKHYKKTKRGISFLREQHKRLKRVVQPYLEQVKKEMEEESSDENATQSLPLPFEFDTVWTFHQAMTAAMEAAIEAADYSDHVWCSSGYEYNGECIIEDGYDLLRDKKPRYRNYQKTCSNKADGLFKYKDYDWTIINSTYQTATFMERPSDKDHCLDLDDILQICTSYRPHYHEFMTHVPARYQEDIKRAVFVGGGDSMLLHELLKYPNMELVLGLELDQVIVRSSLKYFKTQPHFDDERVQWWFGDATKSLLMLPKEYFGTFDLVLVDLSETVVAISVTDHLNIIEALTLLLKPDGVFVKNELYFPELSELFDYTIQTYHDDVPMICDQAYAMGSNRIDFFHPNTETLMKGHGVEMLLLEPIEAEEDRFAHIHSYSKNDARKDGKCGELAAMSDEFDLHAGILLVLEAENTTTTPLAWESVGPALTEALKQEGLTPVSSFTHSSTKSKGDMGVIVLQEGIVAARMWPDESYCAFDIQLWASFNEMEGVRAALGKVVGSEKKALSSYRLIVGGMHGTATWDTDKETVGPRVTQNRNCGVEEATNLAPLEEPLVDIAVEESLKVIQKKNVVAAVICGDANEPCSSHDILVKDKNVRTVAVLWTCPNVKNAQYSDENSALMFGCEMQSLNTLRDAVDQNEKLSVLVVDPAAPIEMLKIARSILKNKRNRERLLAPELTFIAPVLDQTETWRRVFLDRYLRGHTDHDFMFRAEVDVTSADSSLELGIFSAGDPKFFAHLKKVADAIKSREKVGAEIRKIIGGLFPWMDKYNPRQFSITEYDQAPGQAQYDAQRPLGQQMILQLELDSKSDAVAAELKDALNSTLQEGGFNEPQLSVVDEVGDGVVVVALASEGSAIAVWDGKNRCDINLFAFDSNVADGFAKAFPKKLAGSTVLTRDDQPRGVGRVVNLAKDIGTGFEGTASSSTK